MIGRRLERERYADAREAESSVDRGVDCRSVRTLEPVDRETAGGLARLRFVCP